MITPKSETFTKETVFVKLDQLKASGQFDASQYKEIDLLASWLGEQTRLGMLDRTMIKEINSYYGDDFLEGTLQGQALLKKFGYAGDFLMIDRIYTGCESVNPFYRSWDDYFLQCAAVKAVRNRKAFFKQKVADCIVGKRDVALLNVASGPARDLLEIYEDLPINTDLQTTCVEMDNAAIRYAESLTHDYAQNIKYVNRNIFRFNTDNRYDLVWSAGLFDYFDDRAFLLVLKKMKNWVKIGGKIIIGNFNADHNPSRDYMEIIGEWHLIHRTKDELIHLGVQAGFGTDQLSVEQEEEGVNLFLVVEAR